MREDIKKRAISHGLLFIERNATVRSVAKKTSYSKSTVHLDLLRIEKINPELFKKCKEKLDYNKEIRHINGGQATKEKFAKDKK